MNTLNLIGRLTADPELRFTGGGTPVANFRLAVPTPPRDGKDQPAMFIDVFTFGTLAEAVATHVAKGRQIGVSGRLTYRQWASDDGASHSKHEVTANQVEFLAKPAGNGAGPGGTDRGPSYDLDEPF